jgi:hypothetical protein
MRKYYQLTKIINSTSEIIFKIMFEDAKSRHFAQIAFVGRCQAAKNGCVLRLHGEEHTRSGSCCFWSGDELAEFRKDFLADDLDRRHRVF